MRATVLPEPYDDFATKGAKVGGCLWDACEVATAAERRVLARVGALLQIGVWHATALDLMPHPKLAGLCLWCRPGIPHAGIHGRICLTQTRGIKRKVSRHAKCYAHSLGIYLYERIDSGSFSGAVCQLPWYKDCCGGCAKSARSERKTFEEMYN